MFALIGYSMLHNFFGTYQGKRNQRRFPFDESFRFEFPKISRKDENLAKYIEIFGNFLPSLRSWRDFARECFSFGSEAVNASGEAVRGLVKSQVEFHSRLRRSGNPLRASPARNMAAPPPLARSRIPPATQAISYREFSVERKASQSKHFYHLIENATR